MILMSPAPVDRFQNILQDRTYVHTRDVHSQEDKQGDTAQRDGKKKIDEETRRD